MKKTVLCSAALAVALALAAPSQVVAGMPLDEKVRLATEVYEDLLGVREKEIPQQLLSEAHCIAIIPSVIKGALGWGGRHGRGGLTCRIGEGGWSAPVFVSLSGGSFGFQVGAQSADVVLFFMSERSARSLLKSKFTLGADASVAAGPLGRSAEVGTDLRMRAEIYSYAKSRGLFAGVSIEGSRLAPHKKSMIKYYGEKLEADDVLFGRRRPELPPESERLLAVLP